MHLQRVNAAGILTDRIIVKVAFESMGEQDLCT